MTRGTDQDLWTPEQDWSVEDGWDDGDSWGEADSWTEADGWGEADGWTGFDHPLREVMHEDFADADDEAFEDAVEAILGDLSAAEGFSFAKALRQLERGAGQALANPVVGDLARKTLPTAGGALGTVIGLPLGTAICSRVGTVAAGALARPGTPTPTRPAQPAQPAQQPHLPQTPSPATGSAAAAQGLVLTQQPDVLKALMALAMGRYGAQQVGGVPVASMMNMLSQVFGQAAADADELAYLDADPQNAQDAESEQDAEGSYLEGAWDVDLGEGRTLYTTFMDVENEELSS